MVTSKPLAILTDGKFNQSLLSPFSSPFIFDDFYARKGMLTLSRTTPVFVST
jgi:hypothetical protein